MKNKRGRIRSLLIKGISFWIVMYPIYLQYNNLSEIDIFSPIPIFECLDQEELLIPEVNKAKIFGLRFSFSFFSLSFSFVDRFSFLSFPSRSFDQLISILRR